MADISESDEKFAAASFRVFSDTHAAEYFTQIFGEMPDSIGVKGELISPNGRSKAKYRANLYRIRSNLPTSAPLEDHLQALVARVEPFADRFSDAKAVGSVNIFAGYGSWNGQGGAVLSSDLLRRLAALQVDLILDLHPPGAPSDGC